AQPERDYLILGDMNFENGKEVEDILSEGFISLNPSGAFATNTNRSSAKPYDHVLIRPAFSPEVFIDLFEVVDLVGASKKYWAQTALAFPGEPYTHNLFRMYYSDHNPIAFSVSLDRVDDD